MTTTAWQLETKVIHSGFEPEKAMGATASPIVQSSAFAYRSSEDI